MYIEKYKRSHDGTSLARLLKARNMFTVSSVDKLPKLGFVVYENYAAYEAYDAICAGFLREVEGNSFIFDSLISHPNLNSEQRHLGMTMLWEAILTANPKTVVWGTSVEPDVIRRALAAGFIEKPHTLLVRS